MPTLKQEILYYNDSFGKVRPNAKMYFYEAGTTTKKNTYTDEDLANKNQWPLISDGAGVFPPIFLETGGYRIIWKDENDVQFNDRDNLNISDTTILSTSDFYFEDLTKAKLGVSINGSTIDLQIGQAVRTLGSNTSTDGEGAEWLVVAGGTGTADDDLFTDLDNGNQLQRLFNQLYTKNNLSEISDAGAADQQEARDNLDIESEFLSIDKNFQEIEDAGIIAQDDARENIGIKSQTIFTGDQQAIVKGDLTTGQWPASIMTVYFASTAAAAITSINSTIFIPGDTTIARGGSYVTAYAFSTGKAQVVYTLSPGAESLSIQLLDSAGVFVSDAYIRQIDVIACIGQ